MKLTSSEFEELFQEQEQYAAGTLHVLYPEAEEGTITSIIASIKSLFSAMVGAEKDLDFEDASQQLFMQLHSQYRLLGKGVILSSAAKAIDDIVNSIVLRMDEALKSKTGEAEAP